MNTDTATLPDSSASSAPPLQSTVLYFARLGDMVMLTALLSYLHRRFHRPVQVIGAGSWNSAVYLGNPDVARVWSFGRHFPFPLTLQWPRVARALRDSHPGPIYVCEHHWRQLPRIRRMLTFSGVDPRRCVFMTEVPGSLNHSVDRLVRLGQQTPPVLDPADYPLPNSGNIEWAPRLRVHNDERIELDTWLRDQGWAGHPIVMIQPGNHRSMSRRRERWQRLQTDDKAWPIERWVSLLHKVHARMPNALIMLRGSREEVEMLQRVKAATGLDSVVVAGVGLARLFALCEMAHSMISVDTGPAHAAAALGLPLVVMYGAESQRYWLPRSPSGSPVVGIGGPPESVRADQIPVDRVFDAWCTLLAGIEAGPRRTPTASPTFGSFPTAGSAATLRDGARA
ncbi:MAG TPA: glycosyltransferase family 9 protein [Steroidobacteraceae bacterium]